MLFNSIPIEIEEKSFTAKKPMIKTNIKKISFQKN